MSITLDVSNFLQNEIPSKALDASSETSQQAKRKMEALLHKELEDITELPKDDSANIFDEIENFLKLNKFIENSESFCQPQILRTDDTEHSAIPEQSRNGAVVPPPPQSLAILSPLPPQPPVFISCPNLAFPQFTLPECLQEPQFLDMSEVAHDYSRLDPQLYSVGDGQLQLVTSPFLVPGIYKKISTEMEDGDSRHSPPNTKENVFISTNENRGCILSVSRFHELYVCAGPNGEPPEEFFGPTLLLEPLEEAHEEDEPKQLPTLSINCGTRVPKQWDALSKLAYDILKLSNRDQIVIDRERNEIVRTNSATSQKTIYRFLSPENFGLKPHQKKEVGSLPEPNGRVAQPPVRSKFGRPPKRQTADGSLPEKSNTKKSPKKCKRQQNNDLATDLLKDRVVPATTDCSITEPALRTRSGRVVRPRVKTSKSAKQHNPPPPEPDADDPSDFLQSFLTDLKDSDFRCSRPISAIPLPSSTQQEQQTVEAASDANSLTNINFVPPKPKFPPEAVCPTCNKIFLGRRLQRHFVQHPDHMQPPTITTSKATATTKTATTPPPSPPPLCQQQSNDQANCTDLTLFRFLVAKLQRTPLSEDQRADLFLNEINDLVAQLQLRSSRLIRNTSGLHFVSARCSRVLGIPEGHYALDMRAIENEAPPPPPIEPPESNSASCLLNFEHLSSSALPAPLANGRTLEYTALSMSLDDTLTDEAAQKLNLSAGGRLLPPSEESLLRLTVGDLVHDGLQKLQQQSAAAEGMFHAPASKPTLVPPGIHYDNTSDNAVEAVSMKETTAVQQATPLLGLSVDFFQFNSD